METVFYIIKIYIQNYYSRNKPTIKLTNLIVNNIFNNNNNIHIF